MNRFFIREGRESFFQGLKMVPGFKLPDMLSSAMTPPIFVMIHLVGNTLVNCCHQSITFCLI